MRPNREIALPMADHRTQENSTANSTSALRRAVLAPSIAALILMVSAVQVSAAGWESGGTRQNPGSQPNETVKPAGYTELPAVELVPPGQSGFVPRWVPANSAAKKSPPSGPAEVKQAAAFAPSSVRLMPVADPGGDDSIPALEEIAPGPEISPGQEMPDGGEILDFDEYEGYVPESIEGGIVDGFVGDCATCGGSCGPVCGSCGPVGGCWGPGDVWGAGCGPCFAPVFPRLWVRGDALLWWIEGFHVPALVTTSTTAVPFTSGALNDPNGQILFGDGRINDESFSGGRINFGYWFDPCKTAGIEATFFGLEKEVTNFRAASGVIPTLTRPFFDIPTAAQSAWPVAMPAFATGDVTVEASTELFGTEVLYRRALTQGGWSRLDLMAGYRFARLDDSLGISQNSTFVAGNVLGIADGSTLDLFDQFATWNRFHGAEIGLMSQTRRCRWTFESVLKLAFGSTHSFVDIRGASVYTPFGGAPVPTAAGLLAQSTNIGEFSQREFTMLPELGLTIGYDLTRNLRFTLGYSLLYWSKVARPGDQIDLDLHLADVVPPAGLPDVPPVAAAGAIHPQFQMRTTDLWAQGINLGLSYRF